jgi:hypothetical protein
MGRQLVAGELTSGEAGTVRQGLCRLNSNWRLWSFACRLI